MGLFAWDQMHYRETDIFNASGTYTGANNVSYSFNQNSSTASSWDSVSTYTANNAVYATQFGNSYSFDLAASDSAVNFAGNTLYGANGYPISLLASPTSSTTLYAENFTAGSSAGLSVTTNNVVNGQNSGLAQSAWAISNSGIAGSRYYYNNTCPSQKSHLFRFEQIFTPGYGGEIGKADAKNNAEVSFQRS